MAFHIFFGMTSNIGTRINASIAAIATYALVLSCALVLSTNSALAAGMISTWGWNDYGQLGDNTTTYRQLPVGLVDANNVLAGKTIIQISAGLRHTCALTADAGAYCWGDNLHGHVGDNSTTERNTPVAVDLSSALAGKTLIQISPALRNEA